MLSITAIEPNAARRAMESAGGFLWWYLDVVDGEGNGCVLIWSYGLPFLPGYASADRRGNAPPAAERPSLNIAVYRDGELDCYLLEEYPTERVDWRPEEARWRFGATEIRVRRQGERQRVVAGLDCVIPGGERRLQGTVEATGPAPPVTSAETDPSHRWSPRMVAGEAEVDLRAGETDRYRFAGDAYHDANCGTVPFHRLGIARWVWGRCPIGDGELVFYGLWPEGDGPARRCVLAFDGDGEWQRREGVEIELAEPSWSLGGMRWWRRMQIRGPAGASWTPLTVEVREVVDSGPFYMRYLTEARADGVSAGGVAELIRPDRIDLARHRPFVRMRVRREGETNSAWLPLFSGPKRGRIRRLFDFHLGGGAG